jgi:hypothetical protein
MITGTFWFLNNYADKGPWSEAQRWYQMLEAGREEMAAKKFDKAEHWLLESLRYAEETEDGRRTKRMAESLDELVTLYRSEDKAKTALVYERWSKRLQAKETHK